MIQKTFLLLLIGSITVLSGCGSDETPSNTIKIDGTSLKVLFASLLGVSIDGEGHVAMSLTAVSNSGITKSLSIDFEYSTSAPIAGSYSFPQEGNDRMLNEITNYVMMDIVEETQYSTDIESGRVTVKDNGGDNYTLTIDLIMKDGLIIKGTYRGDFEVAFNNS